MKRFYNSVIKVAASVAAMANICACDAWLNVKPQNEQPFDEFWKTKEEVLAVLAGGYTQMRACLNLLVRWGEVRSDDVDLGPALSSDKDMLAVKSLSIQADNGICNWQPIYNEINRCNLVIEYAPKVLETDKTFDERTCRQYVAEAKWLRALSYFYLVRTFKDVPFITRPYVDDSRPFEVPKTDGRMILETLNKELADEIAGLPVSYGLGAWENKGHATVWASYALMADISLWLEDYDSCIEMCEKIEKSDYFHLLPGNRWYRLYYPGNSEESIFELQWDARLNQDNNLFAWFYNDEANNSYAASSSVIAKFDAFGDDSDVRAGGGSYIPSSSKIWKYAGTATGAANIRESSARDSNWIIYRYAEILLMHAECLVMKEDFTAAHGILQDLWTRAGHDIMPQVPATLGDAIDMVLDERLRELCFEGKRWFDLVRTATREDGRFKDKLISLLLLNVPAKDRPLYSARLQNTDGYYLPINESDIIASGGVLVQNTYYQ